MKTARSAAAAGILGFLLLTSPIAARAADTAVKLLPAGEAAPKFEAVDLDGNPFSLEEELTSGPIFLVFWSIF